MKRIAWFSLSALALLLAACAPATGGDAEPVVVVINAPEGAQVQGAADAFVAELRRGDTPGFGILRDVAIAGVENRRNLSGAQATRDAANIARSFGAEWTLMVGADEIEVEVVDRGGGARLIEAFVSVEGVLVRGEDERVLARISSRTFTGERVAEPGEELPEPRYDPLVRELAARAAASLAPTFEGILASQVNGSSSE